MALGFPLLLTACGGGGESSTSATISPAFMSTPGTAATQGTTYTYQIETSPAADGVTLTLASAPSGTILNGNTLTWTPSAAQSRVPNPFSVMATTSGGSATQSWNVTPAGTVSGTWIDTYWTSSGPVEVPIDWTKVSGFPIALVPQPNGSFQALTGSGNSDGTFSIPGVPGGYYWLQPGLSASYWTSSGTLDLGTDIAMQASASASTVPTSTTTMNFNLAGLDPLAAGDEVMFLWDLWQPFSLEFAATSPADATTLSSATMINSNIDFSQSGPAFLLQYEPETLGTLSALRLGSEETLSSLTLSNGTSNTIDGTLAPAPQQSFDLNVKGSAWTPLFNSVGPSSSTLEGASMALTTLPFLTGGHVLAVSRLSIPLFDGVQPSSVAAFNLFANLPVCAGSGPAPTGGFSLPPGEPPITADQDFGAVQYDDPFPSAWLRVFTFCQAASVAVALPGSASPVSFQLMATQSSAVPTSPISPAISQVQNPTINGANLFVANTVGATGVTLNWTAPNGTMPTGYKITTFVAGTELNNVPSYLPAGAFYTAKTSVSLPPLQAGKTYVFLISAILDDAANFETRPNRSALPTASVSVVSAPITISSSP